MGASGPMKSTASVFFDLSTQRSSSCKASSSESSLLESLESFLVFLLFFFLDCFFLCFFFFFFLAFFLSSSREAAFLFFFFFFFFFSSSELELEELLFLDVPSSSSTGVCSSESGSGTLGENPQTSGAPSSPILSLSFSRLCRRDSSCSFAGWSGPCRWAGWCWCWWC